MERDQDGQEILATVRASPGRRIIGIGALGGLGILLIYIAFAQPPALFWQVFLIVVGAAALWCADAMRKATASCVVLTESRLSDQDGTVIAEFRGCSRAIGGTLFDEDEI